MGRLFAWLDARSPAVINLIALLLLLLISIADYLTPPEISTSVFYMIPIAAGAWFGGRASGLVLALLAGAAWTAKDVAFRGIPLSEQWIIFWNAAARLIMFSVVAWLITEVRLRLRREQILARTDRLTGMLNAPAFHDELALQLARADRTHHSMTLVYIDLDNFKQVNDEQGHAEGDRALATVGAVTRQELRRIDTLGRLGGDEFGIILPDTDAAEAETVMSKLHATLMAEMARHDWPITFSIGAITCRYPFPAPDVLVRAADRLMYQVKAAGKNAFLHRTWPAAS